MGYISVSMLTRTDETTAQGGEFTKAERSENKERVDCISKSNPDG